MAMDFDPQLYDDNYSSATIFDKTEILSILADQFHYRILQ